MEWNYFVYDFCVYLTLAKLLFLCQLIEVEQNGRHIAAII